MTPTRAGLKAFNLATQGLLRAISRVIGGSVVRDAVAFFVAFEGMEQGFRERFNKVDALINDPSTAFVVVSAPRRDAVAESLFFAGRLIESGQHVEALVVNRLFPRFSPLPAAGVGGADHSGLEALVTNARDLEEMARSEEHYVELLTKEIPSATVARVPLLDDDVHDLGGLGQVASHLFTT
jgi:anion-transporting  ArsA/GET3 family ATPase